VGFFAFDQRYVPSLRASAIERHSLPLHHENKYFILHTNPFKLGVLTGFSFADSVLNYTAPLRTYSPMLQLIVEQFETTGLPFRWTNRRRRW